MFLFKPSHPDSHGFKAIGASQKAAKSIEPHHKSMQIRVYDYAVPCGEQGFIPDDAAKALGLKIITARARASELCRKGKLIKTGIERKNADGCNQEVLRAL